MAATWVTHAGNEEECRWLLLNYFTQEALKGGMGCWMLTAIPRDRTLRKVRDERTRESPLRAKHVKRWLMAEIATY